MPRAALRRIGIDAGHHGAGAAQMSAQKLAHLGTKLLVRFAPLQIHGASLRRALIPDCKAVQRLDELGTCQQGIHLERDEIGAE
jgi:hypothetical protein